MIRFRPLPMLTVIAVIAFALLVLLGRWQWQRYEERLEAASAPPIEMTIASYRPIEEGIALVYGLKDGEPGWRVFAPVLYGEENLYVDAAFVQSVEPPDWRTLRFPASLTLNAPISGAAITPSPPAPLTHAPSLPDRVWYAVNLEEMARAAGLRSVASYYLATDYVGEDGRPVPNPFVGAGDDALTPARHLGYAATWWGLAIVLVGIYFAYHVSVGRLKFAPPMKK
ncbi:MAG: SURF1 family protein [Hyphomonadaceae bacterium]|nr:SURF1 family protein [Hyphomonadaceae bacterium]